MESMNRRVHEFKAASTTALEVFKDLDAWLAQHHQGL